MIESAPLHEVRCGLRDGSRTCSQLLFVFPAPYTLEVRCARCRQFVHIRFDARTGLPLDAPPAGAIGHQSSSNGNGHGTH